MAKPPTSSASPQQRDERKCRERHAEKMDRLRRVFARINDPKTSDKEREAIRDEFANDLLSVEPLRALKITLSWDGPSDGYRLLFDKDGEEILSGVYWYADWFTCAETPLSREELQWVQDAFLAGEPPWDSKMPLFVSSSPAAATSTTRTTSRPPSNAKFADHFAASADGYELALSMRNACEEHLTELNEQMSHGKEGANEEELDDLQAQIDNWYALLNKCDNYFTKANGNTK